MYAFLVAINANFSVIDDHGIIGSLFIGERIPLFISIENGRFYPLDGQDLNILSMLFGASASVFYTFNAICVILVAFCLAHALPIFFAMIDNNMPSNMQMKQNLARYTLTSYVLIFLVLCSPSFVTSFLRLFVPERMEFVFFSIFLACYAFVLKNHHKKSAYFVLLLGIASATIALYYKETGFAMLFAFAFLHFALSFKYSNLKVKIFDIALMLTSIIWVLVYIFVVVLQKTSSGSYGDTPYNQLIVLAKVIFSYALSEPFLLIVLPCFFIYRTYSVFIKKQPFNALLDSSLCAALVLIAEYLALKIGDIHYILIGYVFGLIALGGWMLNFLKLRFFKLLMVIACVVFVFNSLPFGISQYAHYKVVPNGFQQTLGFLSEYIKEYPNTNIYLEGVNRASNVEVYVSFAIWLNYYGASKFDLQSDLPIDNNLLGKPNPNSPYSVFRSNDLAPKQSGDIVVLSPYTYFEFSNGLLEKLDSKYERLFESGFGYNFPRLGIKPLIKYFSKDHIGGSEMMLGKNSFGLPLKFYIYRVP
ncbi:hypothetical protein BKN38_04135 [Helicobacter sp. CLO-3]|nr:hypothetical protein BA723_00790 [Helicobacter sp. CLO-3]OHU84042.1 hypothetical protein BKN38_04135 [Helicobacter sp. CLO-3]